MVVVVVVVVVLGKVVVGVAEAELLVGCGFVCWIFCV